MPTHPTSVIRSTLDQDWSRDPEAILVRGYFGNPFIDQFPGAGPSPAPFAFKALLIEGIVYMPDPSTRGLEPSSARHWIACPEQPPVGARTRP